MKIAFSSQQLYKYLNGYQETIESNEKYLRNMYKYYNKIENVYVI